MFIWNDYQESYDKKYNMFDINRQYREKSFESEKEYLNEQQKLADEIDQLDKVVEKEIKKIINEAYPDVEILKFDSRMSSSARLVLGRVLTKGIDSETKALEISLYFERKTSHKVHIDRIENFSEEDSKKILEEITKR